MASSGRRRAGHLAMLVVALALMAACKQEPPLPVYGQAPEFSLMDQTGASFNSADLGERVVLANFIYTSCTDTCPLLSATMSQVHERLKSERLAGERVMLLSFSLDPERDTAAVLRSYGERFGADPASWKMLTGDGAALAQIAQDFKVGRPIPLPPSPENPTINLGHSNRFVLIDSGRQMRGYYLGQELNISDVTRDIRRLTTGR